MNELIPIVGRVAACRVLGASRATTYRRGRPRVLGPPPPRPTPARALSRPEREEVLAVLNSDRFCDRAPAEIYAILLDEGRYLASKSTMYRLLVATDEVRERRNQRRAHSYAAPELLATRPNMVWSWDITKLRARGKWSYYYLYVIIDVFSRYVVGWMVADGESAALAERFITDTLFKENIQRDQLTIHADRGSSMKSKAVALLLSDLGVAKTHSRPHVSNDNPYSESQFKTLKYHPTFPDRFGSLEDARAFCQRFFAWYNEEHRHGGIGLMTPAVVHGGAAVQVRDARQVVLTAAFTAHPERFVRKPPEPPALPTAAWINQPKTEVPVEAAQ